MTCARLPYLQRIHVDGADHLLGQIVVRITENTLTSLTGVLVTKSPCPGWVSFKRLVEA
jgi:hypothetical protein